MKGEPVFLEIPKSGKIGVLTWMQIVKGSRFNEEAAISSALVEGGLSGKLINTVSDDPGLVRVSGPNNRLEMPTV